MSVVPRGTGALLRHAWRRDRFLLPWWVVGVVALFWTQAVGVEGLYTTQVELDRAAASMESNPAFLAMAGPPYALDTVGGQTAWQSTAFGAVLLALMAMVTVARHTRADEETGRHELLLAAPVDRSAPLVAAVLLTAIADVVAGVLLTATLVAIGLPPQGSVVLGVGLTLVGLFFAAVAAVAVQLSDGTRTAYGVVGLVVAAAYVLRAVGDVGGNGLTWASPIGWYQAMRAYDDERWWPALLLVAAAAGVGAFAAALFVRRDLGSGLRAARPGPERGRLGALGLTWRLQRGSLVGWVLGLAAAGAAFGSIGDSVGDVVGDGDLSREVLRLGSGDLVVSFHATSLLTLGLLASGFAVSSALRARAEEDAGRSELLLSTALSRPCWVGAHLAVTVGGTVACLAAAGLGLGVGYGAVVGDGGAVLRYVAPALTYVVPALVLSGIALLLTGWAPRLASMAWAALVGCALLVLLGPVLDLPEAVLDVSPFTHLALAPAVPVDWASLAALAGLAGVGGALGLVGVRRRDLR